jgi:hypothetical protein
MYLPVGFIFFPPLLVPVVYRLLKYDSNATYLVCATQRTLHPWLFASARKSRRWICVLYCNLFMYCISNKMGICYYCASRIQIRYSILWILFRILILPLFQYPLSNGYYELYFLVASCTYYYQYKKACVLPVVTVDLI